VTSTLRDAVSPDLRTTLRALKLGQMPGTLPDRLTLARQQKMAHADFLELILADEVTRRETKSASLHARTAGPCAPTRPMRASALESARRYGAVASLSGPVFLNVLRLVLTRIAELRCQPTQSAWGATCCGCSATTTAVRLAAFLADSKGPAQTWRKGVELTLFMLVLRAGRECLRGSWGLSSGAA
jgi:hypothetical protein